MTTEADIGNMALSKLGTRATITSLTENSTEARQINIWYATVRDDLLRVGDWNFARVYAPLALSGTPPSRWGYSYAYPSDCLKFRRIDAEISVQAIDPAVTFEIATDGTNRMIFTNFSEAIGVYTQRVTDPNRMDPEFIMALQTCLAAAIALAITQKESVANARVVEARAVIEQAAVDSANEEVNNESDRLAESLTVRDYNNLSWLQLQGRVNF